MKKMYFLKDRKEAVIDRLTYMSKHRQEYLQDKEHGMITLQFKQGTVSYTHLTLPTILRV